jgi:putative nucleotidyltransferase with HDIG domain
MAAKTLKVSNSPHYGRIREVKTLTEAIIVLGFKAVRSIVIATSMHGMHHGGTDPDSHIHKLWRHALSTALAARLIADQVAFPDKEEAFIAGLLHDIGKLALLEKVPEVYTEIIAEVEKTASRFDAVEAEILQFDHCDVASLMLDKWAIPQMLAQAVTNHHKLPPQTNGDQLSLAHIVNLASHMAKSLNVGFADYRVDLLANLESARLTELDQKSFEWLSQELATLYESEIQSYRAD